MKTPQDVGSENARLRQQVRDLTAALARQIEWSALKDAELRAARAVSGLAWKTTTMGRPAPPVEAAVTHEVQDVD